MAFRVVFAALLAILVASKLAGETRLVPTFHSEVGPATKQVILPLLRAACGEGVRTAAPTGEEELGCGDSMTEILATRSRPRKHPWSPYTVWSADGVIFGHFLSPHSEDVAVNGNGGETHPVLWGGTLLLTKDSGKWKPVWYKPGVITRHCRRIQLDTGRQILFCEETDSGMGHEVHGLYTVDFTNPRYAWHSVVLMADTYGAPAMKAVQVQHIDRVVFDQRPGRGLLVRVFARHGKVTLLQRGPSGPLPKPTLTKYEIEFRLAGEALMISPQTAAAAKLFHSSE